MNVLFWLALVFLAVAFLVAPHRPAPEQKKPFYGRNFAHRGLHTADRRVPENSMPAFRAAVAAGYGIELDIQLSQDGQVVVFHDDTLERVCGVEGRVDAYPLSQLQTFGLAGTEEVMPLFTEVLRTVDGSVPLIVELKTGPRRAELCEKAWALLREYHGPCCIESFDPRIVHWFSKRAPQVLRGQLASTYRDLSQYQSPLVCFAVSRCLVDVLSRPNFIAYHKQRGSWCAALAMAMGAMSMVWTVHPEDEITVLQDKNDAVIFEYYTPRIKY